MIELFKKRAAVIVSIFGLFFTQFLFYIVEVDLFGWERWFVGVVLGAFFVFYLMSLLNVPIILEFIWSIVFCPALLTFVVCLKENPHGFYHLNLHFTVVYLPVCVFFLIQEAYLKNKRKNTFTGETMLFSMAFLGFLIYTAIIRFEPNDPEHGKFRVFGINLFSLVILLYCSVLLFSKSVKKKNEGRIPHIRESFLFGIVSIIETFFLIFVCGETTLYFSVSLFWFVNLLVLYIKEHPLLVIFRNTVEEKLQKFITK